MRSVDKGESSSLLMYHQQGFLERLSFATCYHVRSIILEKPDLIVLCAFHFASFQPFIIVVTEKVYRPDIFPERVAQRGVLLCAGVRLAKLTHGALQESVR